MYLPSLGSFAPPSSTVKLIFWIAIVVNCIKIRFNAICERDDGGETCSVSASRFRAYSKFSVRAR